MVERALRVSSGWVCTETAWSKRSYQHRALVLRAHVRDAAIVLVTPRLAGTIDTDTREFRAETLTELLSVWKELVDSLANIDALTETIRGKLSKHFRPQPGDLHLPAASEMTIARQAIGETLGRLRQ